MSAGYQGAGVGLAVGGGIAGIIGSVRRAKAIRRSAREAARYEDFKFSQFFQDALDEERRVVESNRARYAAQGVDFRHGSPIATEVDVGNEYERNVERARIETELTKRQIALDADAGVTSARISGAASGLDAATTTFGILGRED